MTHYALGCILIGVALLIPAWLAWTGRWRKWAQEGNEPVTILPAFGFLLVLVGLGMSSPEPVGPILVLLSMIVGVALSVLHFKEPSWFGPRWYRAERERNADLAVPSEGAMLRHPRAQNSKHLATKTRGRPAKTRLTILYGPDWALPGENQPEPSISGWFLFYPTELVFAAHKVEDVVRGQPTILSLPADSITDVRLEVLESSGLSLEHEELRNVVVEAGQQIWTVRCRDKERVVSDLRNYYLEHLDTPHGESE